MSTCLWAMSSPISGAAPAPRRPRNSRPVWWRWILRRGVTNGCSRPSIMTSGITISPRNPRFTPCPTGCPRWRCRRSAARIFLLDRRDGKPTAGVEERPVPQGAAYGDWTAPTQPYNTEMPGFGTKALTEADMWGATFFDQPACRIAFKELNYQASSPHHSWSRR